jgi:hypothetical protein
MFDLEFDDPLDFIGHEIPSHDLGFLNGWEPNNTFSPWDETGTIIIGDPVNDLQFYDHQDWSDTCSISSQKMILEQYGIDISEDQLCYEAFTNGWYTPGGGTPSCDVGKLLESHGVECHTIHQASTEQLMMELIQGHKVIVSVDSSELTSPDSPLTEFFEGKVADHSVVVTGMSFDADGEPIVYLNDPDHDLGAGRPILLSTFLAAWDDSGNELIATDFAPSDLAEQPIIGEFFNTETGMYKDESYWSDTLVGLGILVGTAAGAFVIGKKVGDSNTEQARSSMEMLDDPNRNKLFQTI